MKSSDAVMADQAKLPYDVLGWINSCIVAEVADINRMVYNIISGQLSTTK